MRFEGLRVLITGGGSGIGAGLAARFAAEGAQIAICDADKDAVAQTTRQYPDWIAESADVSDEDEMTGFLDRVEREWGKVDVVCANAGTGGPSGAIETLDYSDWLACHAVNLGGSFLTYRWAAKMMKPAGQGVILLTSSTAGVFSYPYRSPYASAKAGLIALMKSLASELGPAGIRVNAICPGAVEGPRMDRVVAMEAAAQKLPEKTVRARYVDGLAMKTWVTVDDVADTALFLASDAAKRISGQALAVDGHTETIS